MNNGNTTDARARVRRNLLRERPRERQRLQQAMASRLAAAVRGSMWTLRPFATPTDDASADRCLPGDLLELMFVDDTAVVLWRSSRAGPRWGRTFRFAVSDAWQLMPYDEYEASVHRGNGHRRVDGRGAWTLDNRTSYDTAELRRIIEHFLRTEGALELFGGGEVAVEYVQDWRRDTHGFASVGYPLIGLYVPHRRLGLERFCFVLVHEIAHTRGLTHDDMILFGPGTPEVPATFGDTLVEAFASANDPARALTEAAAAIEGLAVEVHR